MERCEYCLKDFKNKAALINHIKFKHKELNIYVCKKCGVEIKSANVSHINEHEKYCNGERKEKNKKWFCPKCGFEIKASRKKHFDSCDGSGPRRRKLKRYPGKKGGWNKGLTKETNSSLRKSGETYKRKIESGEIIPSFKGRRHTEETKKKISEARIKYLEEHPDEVPYLLNHSSKGPSYPELYFMDLFRKEEINLSYHKQIGLYELDFFNEESKFYLEVDGEQHYADERIVESDIRKDGYLKDLGWRVYRIRWSEWKKKTKIEKQNIIEEVKELI